MSAASSPIEIDQPAVDVTVSIEVDQPAADAVIPAEVAPSAMDTDTRSLAGVNQSSVDRSTPVKVEQTTHLIDEAQALIRSNLIEELCKHLYKHNGICTLSRLALSQELRRDIPERRFFPILYRALLESEELRDSIVMADIDSSPLSGVYEPLSVGLLHKMLALMPNLESLTLCDVHLGGDDIPLPQREPLKFRPASLTITDNSILHSRPELFAQLLHLFGAVGELNFVNYGRSSCPEPGALYEPRSRDKNATAFKLAATNVNIHSEPGAEGQDEILRILTRELDLAKLQELVVDGLHLCAVGEMHDLLAKSVNLRRLQLAHSTRIRENAGFDLHEKPLGLDKLAHLEELVVDKMELRLGVPTDVDPSSVENNERYLRKLNATIATIPTGALAKIVFCVDTTYGDQSDWSPSAALSKMAGIPWGILSTSLAKHSTTLKEIHFNIKYGHGFASEVNESIRSALLRSLGDIITFSGNEEFPESQQDILAEALRDLGLEDEEMEG